MLMLSPDVSEMSHMKLISSRASLKECVRLCLCLYFILWNCVTSLPVACLYRFITHRLWKRTLHWIDSWTKVLVENKLKSDNTWELVSFDWSDCYALRAQKESISNAFNEKNFSDNINWLSSTHFMCMHIRALPFTPRINDCFSRIKSNFNALSISWMKNTQLFYDLMIDNGYNLIEWIYDRVSECITHFNWWVLS